MNIYLNNLDRINLDICFILLSFIFIDLLLLKNCVSFKSFYIHCDVCSKVLWY